MIVRESGRERKGSERERERERERESDETEIASLLSAGLFRYRAVGASSHPPSLFFL